MKNTKKLVPVRFPLTLGRETVRVLDVSRLAEVAGGASHQCSNNSCARICYEE